MAKSIILTKLARRIRQLRKVNKMTQEQLADKSDLHFTYIGEIEREEKNPTVTSLDKIARAFKISLPELLTFPSESQSVGKNLDTLDKAIQLLDLAKKLGESEKKSR